MWLHADRIGLNIHFRSTDLMNDAPIGGNQFEVDRFDRLSSDIPVRLISLCWVKDHLTEECLNRCTSLNGWGSILSS